ncbi:MAG: cytochrome c [Holophagales bacterium]|nr:cytochrome c [Holophagales bacterium]MYG29521.1 cytochrome c [Holophagales bacterium]MYI79961.1 cytochrome c [Holophagales bacterium]
MTVATRALRLATFLSLGLTAAAAGQSEASEDTGPADDPAAVNPTPYTQAAEKRGRTHYLRHCQICHGFDGRALENIDFEATDLTDPERWRFGTTDGDLFRSTKHGAGLDMPPFEAELDDAEIWELVHYLRSLGPEEYRAAAEPENPP